MMRTYSSMKKTMIDNYRKVSDINKAWALNNQLIEEARRKGEINGDLYYTCLAFNLEAVEMLEDEWYE